MPRLLLFVPCKQAIINYEDGLVTPVSILESVIAIVPPGTPLPPNASIPMSWAIITVWYSESGDAEKGFEQRTQVLLPDGQLATEVTTSIDLTKRTHRHVAHIEGFNISQVGEHWLRLSLREKDQDWRSIAEYPLVVAHATVEIELELQPVTITPPGEITIEAGPELEIPGDWVPPARPRKSSPPTKGGSLSRSQRKKPR